MRVDVWLDGVPVRGVIELDTRTGELTAYRYDDQGQPVVEGDSFVTYTARGVIAVRASVDEPTGT